jgi:predicted PurR-regulated permease PerM
MAKRKSLEDLLEETRKDLEDLIAVLNELKKEVPTEIKEEILLSHRKIEEYINTLREILLKVKNAVERWDQKVQNLQEEINEKIDLITDKQFQVLEEVKREIQTLRWKIEDEVNEALEKIENSAQIGIEKGIENGIIQVEKSIEKAQNNLETTLAKIVKTLSAFRQELSNAENIFKEYQWSWLGIVIVLFLLLAFENLALFGILTNNDKGVEAIKTFLEIGFLLFATYGVYKLSPKLNRWITYSVIALLITTTLFIGFTTIKGKIQVTKKEVCNLPEPDKTVPQQDGSICYFYNNGWYLGKDGKYHPGQVAICK